MPQMMSLQNGTSIERKETRWYFGLPPESLQCAMHEARMWQMATRKQPLQTRNRKRTIEQKSKARQQQEVDLGE